MKTLQKLQDKENWVLATEMSKLEARLWRIRRRENLKRILVSSAIQGEGKSTTVAYLATSLGMYPDRRILVMDFDFRLPTLHEHLGLDIENGFDKVLDGSAAVDDVIHHTELTSLDATFPSAGGADPGLLLRTPQLEAALLALDEVYDLILIDSPAIIPVADATTLIPHVDGILLVAMAGKTSESQLKRAREICEGMDAKILGLVVGNLEEAAPDYVSYDYNSYQHRDEQRRASTRGSTPRRRRHADPVDHSES